MLHFAAQNSTRRRCNNCCSPHWVFPHTEFSEFFSTKPLFIIHTASLFSRFGHIWAMKVNANEERKFTNHFSPLFRVLSSADPFLLLAKYPSLHLLSSPMHGDASPLACAASGARTRWNCRCWCRWICMHWLLRCRRRGGGSFGAFNLLDYTPELINELVASCVMQITSAVGTLLLLWLRSSWHYSSITSRNKKF